MWVVDLWGKLLNLETGARIEVVEDLYSSSPDTVRHRILWTNAEDTVARSIATSLSSEEALAWFQKIIDSIPDGQFVGDISGLGGGQ